MPQSVLAGQVAPAAVPILAVAADCEAKGIVTSTGEPLTEIACRAEIVMSAAVAALPVLVVTCPVIEAADWFVPVCATSGTVPNAFPGCTPVITVAPYSTCAALTATATTS